MRLSLLSFKVVWKEITIDILYKHYLRESTSTTILEGNLINRLRY